MAIQATYQALTFLVGDGLGGGAGPYLQDTQQTTPTNINAPPPQSYNLVPGNITCLVPTGFTVRVVQLQPPAGSLNAKSITTSGGVVALSGWTSGSITLPVVAGGSFYIQSAGSETIKGAFS